MSYRPKGFDDTIPKCEECPYAPCNKHKKKEPIEEPLLIDYILLGIIFVVALCLLPIFL